MHQGTMPYSPSTTAVPTPRATTPVPGAALDALAQALIAERGLIEELAAVMLRQRAAIAADDLAGVDDSVFATHRLLLTLAEARKRRRSINQLVGCPENTGVKQLDEMLGANMTVRLRTARAELQESARRLSCELEVNRRVLREAMAQNESFVRTLRGEPEHQAAYSATGTTAYAAPSTAAFSRTV